MSITALELEAAQINAPFFTRIVTELREHRKLIDSLRATIQAEVEAKDGRIEALQRMVDERDREIGKFNMRSMSEPAASLQQQLGAAQQRIASLEKELGDSVNQHNIESNQSRSELVDLRSELDRVKAQLRDANSRLEHHRWLIRTIREDLGLAMGDGIGLRGYILDMHDKLSQFQRAAGAVPEVSVKNDFGLYSLMVGDLDLYRTSDVWGLEDAATKLRRWLAANWPQAQAAGPSGRVPVTEIWHLPRCSHPGCENHPTDCRCEHHIIDRPDQAAEPMVPLRRLDPKGDYTTVDDFVTDFIEQQTTLQNLIGGSGVSLVLDSELQRAITSGCQAAEPGKTSEQTKCPECAGERDTCWKCGGEGTVFASQLDQEKTTQKEPTPRSHAAPEQRGSAGCGGDAASASVAQSGAPIPLTREEAYPLAKRAIQLANCGDFPSLVDLLLSVAGRGRGYSVTVNDRGTVSIDGREVLFCNCVMAGLNNADAIRTALSAPSAGVEERLPRNEHCGDCKARTCTPAFWICTTPGCGETVSDGRHGDAFASVRERVAKAVDEERDAAAFICERAADNERTSGKSMQWAGSMKEEDAQRHYNRSAMARELARTIRARGERSKA